MNSTQCVLVNFLNSYLNNYDLYNLGINAGKSSALMELYQKVSAVREKQGLPAISIRLISKEEIGSNFAFQDANCDMKKGKITIPAHFSLENKLAGLAFELANLSQKEVTDRLEKDLDEQKISDPVECAKIIERMEFNTVCIQNDIIKNSILKKQWDISVIKHMYKHDTFEKHWEKALKNGHAQYYIDHFKKVIAKFKS